MLSSINPTKKIMLQALTGEKDKDTHMSKELKKISNQMQVSMVDLKA